MISHELQFIFIHIPKTSGNSLSLFLQKYLANSIIQKDISTGKDQGIDVICEKTNKDIKHKKIAYYYKMYPNKTKQYFKFTIVRNPYDRILSLYFWWKSFLYKKQKIKNNQFKRDDFKRFLIFSDDFQYKYIMNPYENKHNFHIVHYENMMEELKQLPVFQKKEKDISFEKYPVLNASENSKKRFQERYDKELQDLVYNKWKKDFELFGYSYAMPS
jgi:hypothetical protein